MADITITDQVNLSTSVQFPDDSPLALANLTKLHFNNLPIIGDFGKPMDCFSLDAVSVGVDLTTPNLLMKGSNQLLVGGGLKAAFSVCTPKQQTLFADDGFAPGIEIKPNECWAGLSINTNLSVSAGATTGGVGVTASAATAMTCGTFVHFPAPGNAMPTFKQGFAAVLENYSILNTPAKIRAIPVGIAHTSELDGSISLGAAYSAPLELNPLASLAGPLNYGIAVTPTASASIEASITLEGSFAVRTYRSSESRLVFGVYKKKQTALSVSLSTSVGMLAVVGKSDLLGKVVDAIVPRADSGAVPLDDSQRGELQRALSACVDQSVSVALNASCAASDADEAAVIYELDLTPGDMTMTDAAIESALQGNWSALESLPNARLVRNIVRELRDRNHKLTIHLLGFYNAVSISDFLQSSTVLHDEHGQISIVDKVSAQQLSARSTPYAAKSDRLRSALSQAMMATVAYGSSASRIGLTTFAVRQSFLEYRAQASCSDLSHEVLLAKAVGLDLDEKWNGIAKSSARFNQSKFCLDVRYDERTVMRLFYRDVENRIPHVPADLDRIGRDTKIALLDPTAANSVQRRLALSDDNIWDAMNRGGNVAAFKLIPGLAKMNAAALGAISADFIDIRWWSDSLQDLTPRVTAVLKALDQSRTGDMLNDAAFMGARKNLERAMGKLTSKTQGTFGDGCGLAMMYRLAKSSNGQPLAVPVQMDIGWNRHFEHFETGTQIAVGRSSGS